MILYLPAYLSFHFEFFEEAVKVLLIKGDVINVPGI